MKINAGQLRSHLDNDQSLSPVYLVSGDEPLQCIESHDNIVAAAKSQGFDERVKLKVERGFDWRELSQASQAISLFASKRILDLDSSEAKIDVTGKKALLAYVERPSANDILVVSCVRLDASEKRAKWYKAIESVGVHVEIWPVEHHQLVNWLVNRGRAKGVRLTSDAAALLAARSEGHLLSAAQEIDKLALSNNVEVCDIDQVLAASIDNARYNSFDLIDAILGGEKLRSLKIVNVLQDEKQPIPALVGALSWAIRAVFEISAKIEQGQRLDSLLTGRHAAWRRPSAKVALTKAIRRRRSNIWCQYLAILSEIDNVAKGGYGRKDPIYGHSEQRAWMGLRQLCLRIAA